MTLGVLQPIELRAEWRDEAADFTPWLAENIQLLGDAIKLDLEVEAQEKAVGPFSADILCRDLTDGSWVVVENQLESTNHSHLGQILTYAAGLKAEVVIWVARDFREEHRAAIDWLNEISGEELNFFGVQIELWKIGESPAAPRFNVVAKPNQWFKEVRSASRSAELTDTKKLQFEFWTAYCKAMEGSPIRCQKPRPQHWTNHAIGRSNFTLCSVASTWSDDGGGYEQGEIRTALILHGPEHNAWYEQLLEDRESIEEEFGGSLIWQNPEDTKRAKVFCRTPADIANRDKWPEQHQWLREHLEALHRVFANRVRSL